jgi:hypothetical protein
MGCRGGGQHRFARGGQRRGDSGLHQQASACDKLRRVIPWLLLCIPRLVALHASYVDVPCALGKELRLKQSKSRPKAAR